MTINLRALWKAILDAPTGDTDGLHWRGDELWCGPNQVGQVGLKHRRHDLYIPVAYLWGQLARDAETKDEARAALEAAAREQIATLFKEQS